MACGLTRDNVERGSKLIREGRAVLKVSVYPWGDEFDLVQGGPDKENLEGESDDEV